MSKRDYVKERQQRLAQARIQILWQMALQETKKRPEIARQQMLSARRIAQRTRTKLPQHMSQRICKKCGSILIPGDTCRVRLRNNRTKHIVVTCTHCGNIKRYHLKV